MTERKKYLGAPRSRIELAIRLGLRDKVKCGACNMTQEIYNRMHRGGNTFFYINRLFGFDEGNGIYAPRLSKMIRQNHPSEYLKVFYDDVSESGTGAIIKNWHDGPENARLAVSIECKECQHDGTFTFYEDIPF